MDEILILEVQCLFNSLMLPLIIFFKIIILYQTDYH